MTSFRYTLEPYKGLKTKHNCPKCAKRRFTRYIDSETGEYLNDSVGRCDRESNCGYHYKPAQYFKDNGLPVKKDVFRASFASPRSSKIYISYDILKQSRTGYKKNSFVSHLSRLFDAETVSRLISTYQLGTSSGRWSGACLFWFIDYHGRIHAGQVKLFDSTGHTAKYISNGERFSCTTWIHSILKQKLKSTPDWLAQYCDQEKKVTCLFGEHLIRGDSKPIAIVEAPATAIVASAYLPQFTWTACGSLSYLTPQRCEVLKGKRVVLFPDLNGYTKWKSVADKMGFYCSSLLEERASEEEKRNGLDLRDYLERFRVSEFK